MGYSKRRRNIGTLTIGKVKVLNYTETSTVVSINGDVFSFGFDMSKKTAIDFYESLREMDKGSFITIITTKLESLKQINSINFCKRLFSLDKFYFGPNKVYVNDKTFSRSILRRFTNSEILPSNFIDKTDNGNVFYTFYVCAFGTVFAATFACKVKNKLEMEFFRRLRDCVYNYIGQREITVDSFSVSDNMKMLLEFMSIDKYVNDEIINNCNGDFVINIQRLEKSYLEDKRDS